MKGLDVRRKWYMDGHIDSEGNMSSPTLTQEAHAEDCLVRSYLGILGGDNEKNIIPETNLAGKPSYLLPL